MNWACVCRGSEYSGCSKTRSDGETKESWIHADISLINHDGEAKIVIVKCFAQTPKFILLVIRNLRRSEKSLHNVVELGWSRNPSRRSPNLGLPLVLMPLFLGISPLFSKCFPSFQDVLFYRQYLIDAHKEAVKWSRCDLDI